MSHVNVVDHVRVGDQVSLMIHQEAGHVVMMTKITMETENFGLVIDMFQDWFCLCLII